MSDHIKLFFVGKPAVGRHVADLLQVLLVLVADLPSKHVLEALGVQVVLL